MYKKLLTLILSLSISVCGTVTAFAISSQTTKDTADTTSKIIVPKYDITINGGIGDEVIEFDPIVNVSASVVDKTTSSAIVDIYTNSTDSFTLDLYRDYDDVKIYSYNESSMGSREFRLSGLTPETDYTYKIFDESDRLVYSGTFRTLPLSSSSSSSSSNSSISVSVVDRTTDSANIEVRTNVNDSLRLYLYRDYYNGTYVGNYSEDSWLSGRFRLINLNQNTDYYYEIVSESDNRSLYRGSFRTLSNSYSPNYSINVSVLDRTYNSANIEVRTNLNDSLRLYLYRDYYNGTYIGNYAEDAWRSRKFRLTNLNPNTDYYYEIINESNKSSLYRGSFRTLTSSSSSSGSSNNNSSISSNIYEIKEADINRATIKDTTAIIPVSNTSLVSSMNEGRNFSTSINDVTVTYRNGNIELVGLIPGRHYGNLTISYTDKSGTSRRVTVASFTTKSSESKVRQFIIDVYKYSLNRQPDEKGFSYWENQLIKKVISPENFIMNLLSEKEFSILNTTTSAKIDALYKVIVNRNSDAVGLKYWTDKFEDLKRSNQSDSSALTSIANEMISESEFQARLKDLGI